MNEQYITGGTYYTDSREVILNFHRIPERVFLMAEDSVPYRLPRERLRTNEAFIDYLRRNHSNFLQSFKIHIEVIPKFFNWKIIQAKDDQVLITEFPWEELARAYVYGDHDHPLRIAIQTGEVQI